jgi:hypothetical protein
MMRTKEVVGSICTPCSKRLRQMRARLTFVPARDIRLPAGSSQPTGRQFYSGDRILFGGPLERGLGFPHLVQDYGQLSRDGDARFSHTTPPGEAYSPALQG